MQRLLCQRGIIFLLSFTGYLAPLSWGQENRIGFRYPVGDFAVSDGHTVAMTKTFTMTVSELIRSERWAASGVSSAVSDDYHWSGSPPTQGAGSGDKHEAASATVVVTVKGNTAWIEANVIGASEADLALAVARNYPPEHPCTFFSLQQSSSRANQIGSYLLPFIMLRSGTVLLKLTWTHAAAGSGDSNGTCSVGTYFEYAPRASYHVSVSNFFSDEFASSHPAMRHYSHTIFLPAGLHHFSGSISSFVESVAVAVLGYPESLDCGACTSLGGAGSDSSLSVMIIAHRTSISVPLDAVRADVNGDYHVDDADLIMVLSEYGLRGEYSLADVNRSGYVDDADLLTVLVNYGAEY